jgi:glycosyltransferase involved in cell wall biosynthesis
VREHGVGLTYPGGDVRALADAVCRLLKDRELYESCQARARAYAAVNDWCVIVRQHVELYELQEAA